MKKVYIILMGLMTCMCLITTSCSSADEDDNFNNPSIFTMANVLRQGRYSGHWKVNGYPADSCEMAFDGISIAFSNMPVTTILREARLGLVPDFKLEVGSDVVYDKEIVVNAGGFVIEPVLKGFSESNTYFSSSFKGNSYKYQGLTENMDLTDVSYLFSATDGEDTWYYGIVFDEENYGVLSKEQSSRVIKFTIKEIIEYDPPQYERMVWHTWSIPLIFISNDL